VSSFIALWLAAAIWLAFVLFFRHYRIWIIFYTIASVGLAFLIIFASMYLLPVEHWLEMVTAHSAHVVSQIAGIPTRIFEVAPDILVWVVVQEPGWTVVRVDLECSGLLEMAVLAGLLLFYPAWSAVKRVQLTLVGWLATYGANVVRIFSIIAILHFVGKRSIFIAHTIVGRVIFSVLVAALYWIILTRPTIRILAGRLIARMRT